MSEQILICIRYFGNMAHLTFMPIKRISETKNRDTKRYLLNISINRMGKTIIQQGERGKTEKKSFHNYLNALKLCDPSFEACINIS